MSLQVVNDDGPSLEDMTLRDYFAAKVIQGMSARDMYDNGQRSPTDRARLAYLEADAMLAERAK